MADFVLSPSLGMTRQIEFFSAVVTKKFCRARLLASSGSKYKIYAGRPSQGKVLPSTAIVFPGAAGVLSIGRKRRRVIFREVEDRDLIAKAGRGDVDAFNVLVSRWERRVFTYLVRLVRNREDALDLAQDTFLKAYRGLARLESAERFPQWLFRIAHNEAMSEFRRGKLPLSDEDDFEAAQARLSPAAPRAPGAETGLIIRQALTSLPAEQREAVMLKVNEGFKFEEIAEITGCPVSTVKSRVYAGLEALRRHLEPRQVRAGGGNER